MQLWQRLSLIACFVFVPNVASAQYTRDKSATGKIDEAINQHYLATDFAKAESVLTGTIKACEDKCKPSTVAKAWMYVGIVRGSGKSDQAGAKDAFVQAVAADPSVVLDEALATPETKATFEGAGGKNVGNPQTTAPEEPAKPPPPDGEEGEEGGSEGLTCWPQVKEVETRRAIPVSCKTDEEATSMQLRYKEFGSDEWKTAELALRGQEFRGEIPCSATQFVGALRYYVRAKDKSGETVDNLGSKKKSLEIQVVNQTNEPPPALPGGTAPARCAGEEICPPDFPGCKGGGGPIRGEKDWGASCDNSIECKAGLLCTNGSCETAPSCETNTDCATGVCSAGKCDVGEGEEAGPSYKKNWFGLHVAQDVAFVGGADVCTFTQQQTNHISCYYAGTSDPYPPNRADIEASPGALDDPNKSQDDIGDAYPGRGIGTGTAIATTRVLLSYDRGLTPNFTLGLRAGYAFRGGPKTANGTAFLPIHAELRAAYWFGRGALGKKGIRPYVHLGGGLAQVDAKVKIKVRDCSELPDTQTADPQTTLLFEQCYSAAEGFPVSSVPEIDLDAWKKLGQGFVTLGGGVVYAFKENMGVQLNVNGMAMLPAFGIVIEPSLGFVMGL